MRALLLPMLLLITACRQESANEAGRAPPVQREGERATFAAQGRDRLCLAGPTAEAAVVSYGTGDASCLARGRLEGDSFVPAGDEQCRIPVTRQGEDRISFGSVPPACAYYCGPGASLEGKTFVRMEKPEPVADIAGDPLC